MNAADRLIYAQSLDTDTKRQLEIALCRVDIVHFVSHWLWTYDPRLINRGGVAEVPMDLWGEQVEFLEWIKEREKNRVGVGGGICEKSRDVGATYLACGHATHGFLFRPGFRAGFGSLTEDEVDKKGDMKSIFERIRFMLRRLPKWMMPKGWNWATCDSHCRLTNYETSASITGDCGDNIGRGDRTSIYFPDEAAHLIHADMIDAALAATTECRIDISTPYGMNHFAQKRFSGDWPVFTLSWKSDPRKQETRIDENGKEINVFREKKIKEIGTTRWNQEYDLDYAGSVEGLAIPPEWVRAAVDFPIPEGEGPIVGGLDIAEEGNDKCVLIDRRGPRTRSVTSWGKCTTHETTYRATDECTKRGITTLHFDTIGVGTGPKGIWIAMEATRELSFYPNPVNVGEAPSENTFWPDGMSSKEKFANLKAELWWKLRTRFEKTFEHTQDIKQHPIEEMISIPNHPQLISELSMPKYERLETGKIRIEQKASLRRRGIKSPDFAEALVFAYIEPLATFALSPLGRQDSAFLGMPKGVGYQPPASKGGGFTPDPMPEVDPYSHTDYLGFRS